MATFSEWLFGSQDKLNKFDTGTKEQQALHNSILGQAMGMPQRGSGYDLANQYYNNFLGANQQEAYQQFSDPYYNNFKSNYYLRLPKDLLELAPYLLVDLVNLLVSMLTGEDGFGPAARTCRKSTRGARTEAPATRRKCRRL